MSNAKTLDQVSDLKQRLDTSAEELEEKGEQLRVVKAHNLKLNVTLEQLERGSEVDTMSRLTLEKRYVRPYIFTVSFSSYNVLHPTIVFECQRFFLSLSSDSSICRTLRTFVTKERLKTMKKRYLKYSFIWPLVPPTTLKNCKTCNNR